MQAFVSYAQNFEDVILYRVLADVENGTYVDVGAQHPIRDSVTRAFYERGWRGINIEPVDDWYRLLCVDRPEDVNLKVVIGANAGSAEFYSVANTGLSTTDVSMARQHAANGIEVAGSVVPVRTLTDVIEQAQLEHVHFLKIDVEGAEESVLRGLDLSLVRPWVIVIEATLPNTRTDISAQWSSLICDSGYEDVYFDGLNRFYLARERITLADRFGAPPNCFDRFVKYEDWARGEEARKLKVALERANDTISRLTTELALEKARDETVVLRAELQESERVAHYWWHTAEEMRSELTAIKGTRSWRWTAPLRMGGRASVKWVFTSLKLRSKRVVLRAIRFALVRPPIKRRVVALLGMHPGLLMRVKRFAVRSGLALDMGPSVSVDGLQPGVPKRSQLSPRANRILCRLEKVMAERKS